jgi:hypothetical protein
MIRWKFITEPIEFISDSVEQLERHKLSMAKKLKITNLEITILNDNSTPTKPLSSFSNTAGFAQSTVSVDTENVQHEQTSAQLLNVHGDVVGTVGSLTNFSHNTGSSSTSSSGDSHTN